MTNLEYYGNLTNDINLIKKTSEKRQKLFSKLDITYLCILAAYLIFIFVRIGNGLSTIPSLNIFVNTLIITRNLISIKLTKNKTKAEEARSKIGSLIGKIFNAKIQDNNLPGKLFVDDFENSVIIENEEHVKRYNEKNDVQSYIDTVTSYIYLLDSENTINVLKEVKRTIQEPKEEKSTEVTLELLSPEDLPEDLPVRQVLRFRKDD